MLQKKSANKHVCVFLLHSGQFSHLLDQEVAVMEGVLVQNGQGKSSEVTPAARSCASQEVTQTFRDKRFIWWRVHASSQQWH